MAEFIQPGHVKLKVVNPAQHWDAPSHGTERYDHQIAPDGSVFVIVPIAAVRPLLRAGYTIDDDRS